MNTSSTVSKFKIESTYKKWKFVELNDRLLKFMIVQLELNFRILLRLNPWLFFKIKCTIMNQPLTSILIHFDRRFSAWRIRFLRIHQYFAETYSFLDSASCASSEAIFKLSEFSVFVVASIVSFNFFSDATFSLINVNDVSLVTFAFGAETDLLYSVIKTLFCRMKTNSDYKWTYFE